MADLAAILLECSKYNPSDILLVPGAPPMLRVDTGLAPLPNAQALSAPDCKQVIYSMLTEPQKAQFEKTGELDLSIHLASNLRYRANIYIQRAGVAAALRTISARIPTPEQIGLTPNILYLCDLPRGLVLVTGPTGAGKSTTLAAMIEYINHHQRKHILTIEDPIEYLYQNDKSIIDQREVGKHTTTFAQALKYALRQNPDIILIGEMRDPETMELAMKAAETGHLCFSTLHTKDGPSTIQRIVSEFPSDQREKILTQLSGVLCGVVSQNLVSRKGGGRVCARGVMMMTPAVRTLVRDNKLHQIYGVIESSIAEGMCSADQHLASLVQQKLVEPKEAVAFAHNLKNFQALMSSGVDFAKIGSAPPPSLPGA